MYSYSFKDLVGAYQSPILGNYVLNGGQIGLSKITITMATERTEHTLAADGTVGVSYISGFNGDCTIEMLQTSDLDSFLIADYNARVTAAEATGVAQWAGATLTFRSISTQRNHILTGISFGKLPDRPYGAQMATISWKLMVASSITT
jgi:hypothetical protein